MTLCYSTATFAGGGWANKKGELYLKVAFQQSKYNQYYAVDGRITDDDRTRSINIVSIYSEYGFTNRLSSIIYLPIYQKASLFEKRNSANGVLIDQGDNVSSVGDTKVSFKYGIKTKGLFVLSGALLLEFPFGKTQKGIDKSLQTGDGEFNQMLSINYGLSIPSLSSKINTYTTGFIGFNNRTEGFSDEFRYGFEVGAFSKHIGLIIKAYGVESFKNGSLNDDLTFNGLLYNNTEYLMIAPELVFNFNSKLGASINIQKAVFGKLIFTQASYAVGIHINLNKK